jgi:hypothetical protein
MVSALPGSRGSVENGAIWNWASGRVRSGVGLEEPDDVEWGCRQRPAPGGLVLRCGRLLAGLGAEYLVVPEVVSEPELQQELAVLPHPGADVRAVDQDVDAGGLQDVRGTDAREMEDLGGGDAAGREDDLAGGLRLDAVPVAAPAYADRPAVLEQYLVDEGVQADGEVGAVDDRVQECGSGVDPAAVADRRHRVADAFLVAVIEIERAPPAETPSLGAGTGSGPHDPARLGSYRLL